MFTLLANLLSPVIYLISVILIILSLCGRNKVSIYFLVFILPLQNIIQRMQQFPLGSHFINIFFLAIILGWLLKSMLSGEKIFEKTSLNIIIFLLIISTYISLWWGSFHMGFSSPLNLSDERLINWKNYIFLPILYLIVVNKIKSIKQIKWIFTIMLLSMFLMDKYCLKQISWMVGLDSRDKIVGSFVWLGPNEVAAFYAEYTLILLGIFIYEKLKPKKIILGIIMLINFYCLLFLFSRGAYIAILSGLIFFALFKKRSLLIPLVLLLIFWQAILPKNVVERINYTTTTVEGSFDPSSTTRIGLWSSSMDVFKNEPLIGIGFGGFPLLGLEKSGPHNIYLQTLVEQGVFGLGVLLLLFILALRSGWRLYKNANDTFLKGLGFGFTACVISVMACNFFGDRWTFLQLGAYFWIFLGLAERGNIITLQQKLDGKQVKIKR